MIILFTSSLSSESPGVKITGAASPGLAQFNARSCKRVALLIAPTDSNASKAKLEGIGGALKEAVVKRLGEFGHGWRSVVVA